MWSLLTALINGEKTQHFGVQACRWDSWALELIHLQKVVVFPKDQFVFQQALPHEGEEFRQRRSQPLGWGGQAWFLQPQTRGVSGCPAAVPLVVYSDALLAAFFILKDGCGWVGQGP